MSKALHIVLLFRDARHAAEIEGMLRDAGLHVRSRRVWTMGGYQRVLARWAGKGEAPEVVLVDGELPQTMVQEAIETTAAFSNCTGVVLVGGSADDSRVSSLIKTWSRRYVPARSLDALPQAVREVAHEASELSYFRRQAALLIHKELEPVSSWVVPFFAQLRPVVFVKDAELRFLYASVASAAAVGMTPEDIIGKTDYDLFPQEEAERYRFEDRQAMASPHPVRDAGSGFVKVPVRDPDGRAVGLVGWRGWSSAETAAARRVCHWASAVESSTDGMLCLAGDGTILTCNPASEDMYGCRESGLIGTRLTDFVLPRWRQGMERCIEQASLGATVRGVEAAHRAPQGGTIWVSATFSPIVSISGAIAGICALLRDVSRARSTEEALGQALTELSISHAELGDLAWTFGAEGDSSDPHRSAIMRLARGVRQDPAHPYDFRAEAARMHLSFGYFRALFRRYTGRPPHSYVLAWRMRKAAWLLRDPSFPVKAIAHEVGYNTSAQFSKMFRRKTGVSPSEYRAGISARQ